MAGHSCVLLVTCCGQHYRQASLDIIPGHNPLSQCPCQKHMLGTCFPTLHPGSHLPHCCCCWESCATDIAGPKYPTQCCCCYREYEGVTERASISIQLRLQLLPSLLNTTHKLPPLLQLVLLLLLLPAQRLLKQKAPRSRRCRSATHSSNSNSTVHELFKGGPSGLCERGAILSVRNGNLATAVWGVSPAHR